MIGTRLFIALVLVLTTGCRAAPFSPVLAITGVTVIDVRDGSRTPNTTMVVNSGRITALGPDAQITVPSTAQRIDYQGKYVIPGLWDVHTHIQNERELDVFFPLLIANGILGIRDCEGLFPSEFRNLGDRQPYRPRVFASGRAVDGPAPAGMDDAAIVDELANKGSDFIKIFSLVPRARFLAIAKRAPERGLQIAGHIPTAVPAAEASDAGLRTMEHFDEILLNVSSREDELRSARLAAMSQLSGKFSDLVWEQAFPVIEPFLSSWSDEKASALFAKFVKNNTWQIPTLELYRVWTIAPFDDPAFWDNRDLAFMPTDWRSSWHGEHSEFLIGRPPAERLALRHRVQQWYQSQMDVAQRMHKAGVKFLAGTDVSNWNFMVPGFSLHDELVRFVEAGLSPLEALQTATLNPAVYLGADDAGVVAVSKRADFVVLDADPTLDIKNTRRIVAVSIGGNVIDRRGLDGMLEKARDVAAKASIKK
jgi:hypothetical protein